MVSVLLIRSSGFCSALHCLHENKGIKWSTGLTISPSKHQKHLFCNTPSVNHFVFKSISEPKRLEIDHVCLWWRRMQVFIKYKHSALSKALQHQRSINFKNPSCENSCYANEIVTGCFFTRRSWNCLVRSLRTFWACITVCSLRLKWVVLRDLSTKKKKTFVWRRVLTLYFCCCCQCCRLVLHNIFE